MMLDLLRTQPVTVLKLGGSLFDLPDLAPRLLEISQIAGCSHPVVVPGGGGFAEEIRKLDQQHGFEVEQSHALSIYSLSLSSRFVAGLSSRFFRVKSGTELEATWSEGSLPILDVAEFTVAHAPLPSSWEVTSDSIAAWIASLHPKSKLILLKSVELPQKISMEAAASAGIVDGHFPHMAASLHEVRWCSLRDHQLSIAPWKTRECGLGFSSGFPE